MQGMLRWALGLAIAALMLVAPVIFYRHEYTYYKRLREVAPGVLYRSGQLPADGFVAAVTSYQIRTVINVQDDYPDPELWLTYFNRKTIKESDLCGQLGVHYLFIQPDLISRRRIPAERPAAIDHFLAVMDDPANHPVLLHCRAGLHRTGVLAAIYRMEYQGWTPEQAIDELKACGFGEFACSSANDYITQYILTYRRGVRRQKAEGRRQKAEFAAFCLLPSAF
ncbi:MAG TPA: tyrosine-protein phosphatase [Gemmataceae bacterium]|nr:tyrosine-protein phosphatase [Gemmataceae bacterium]